MNKPFDFEDLPAEITMAMRDMLLWRIANEMGHLIDSQNALSRMDASAGVLALWCGQQGELMQRLKIAEKDLDESMKDDPIMVGNKRAARKRRVAISTLKLVRDE